MLHLELLLCSVKCWWWIILANAIEDYTHIGRFEIPHKQENVTGEKLRQIRIQPTNEHGTLL